MKLTERQHDLLKRIRFSGYTWHAPADLPDPGAARILSNLTSKGLLHRRTSKVNGRYVYAITEDGKTLIRQLHPDPLSRQLGAVADTHAVLHDAGAF